jgi:hypothetical protein
LKIEFKGDLPLPRKGNRINQGDIVFCKASGGCLDVWGICTSLYDNSLKKYQYTIVSFNGGGTSYIVADELYLNETYSYWTIIKRISCDKVKMTIEEIS